MRNIVLIWMIALMSAACASSAVLYPLDAPLHRPTITWQECSIRGDAKYECLSPEDIRALLGYVSDLEVREERETVIIQMINKGMTLNEN